MASSSAGSSRSSSSNRQVERTLSDSSFGNMMPSLKAQASTVKDKGKRKATVVQDDEEDDVIVLELGGSKQTSSSKSRQPRASSTTASATSTATSKSIRLTQATPSEPSSSTAVAPKNTQRKRKQEPGDGFKMDFKHTQPVTQPASTSRKSSSSSHDPTRPTQPRPTALPPSSSRASSSRSLQSSSKHSSTAEVLLTQSGSSFAPLLPSSLAGSTQDKPKLKPLRDLRPPAPFSTRSTSPLPSPPPVKAAAQTLPRPPSDPPAPLLPPSVTSVTSRPDPRPPSLPPSPPKAPSPRKRKRTPPQPRSPTVDRILATTDWAELHPSLEISRLFRLEYALHGGLTYNQARTAEKKAQFAKVTRKSASAAVVLHYEPSWIKDDGAVATLKKKLGSKEHFVAVVWARDVLGRNKMEEGSIGQEGELRKAVVGGVDMYLLGKEFPLKFVIIVGMIVGISENDTTISYEVDDGTGVILCTCPLRRPDPIFIFPRRSADGNPKTPSPRKRKVDELVEAGEDRLEVGTLVKVVGTLEEHWVATADRKIVAEKIEALYDANLEAEHHLQVARLHREVYSKPLDLKARLAQIKQVEDEQWSHLSSIQASSSAAGTPTKRIRLRGPIKLHDDDITPQNFITYIRQHLRDEHVDRSSPPTSQPSSMPHSSPPSSDGAFWGIRYASQEHVEEPTAFTLDDIESDRRLVTFATRLAQKLEREKRAKRKLGALEREKGKLWVRKQGKEGLVSVKGIGSNGGSALLLRTVSSGIRSSKERKETTGEEQPLEGAKLEKAISKCFREALVEMRKKGVIVLSEPEAEEPQWASDSRDLDDSRYLPDAPSYSSSKRQSGYEQADQGPWPLLFADSEEEEEDRRPSPSSVKQSVGSHGGRSPGSWTRSGPWDIILEDEDEKDAVPSVTASPNKSTESEPRQPLWDIIFEDDEVDKKMTTANSTPNARHTPRSTHTRSPSHLPSSPSTVKPSRTTNLVSQDPTISLRPSQQSSRHPSSPPTFNVPPLFQSPRDRTFVTDSSWTTSVAGVDQETYELVTHTSLAGPVLRVLRNVFGGQAFGAKPKAGGVSERGVREALVRDERWAGVATYSDLVGKTLRVLEEQGEAQKVGLEEWRPTRGLGFSKGRG
ncbi:hypothetical protein BCR35DRAFT_323084 [Leucosporidium creatinivorum]|uniref:CST complex subunit Stn1 N-terminal domain-containing protein n=1 Tax=Leucosporidium creatinivorum TaxID=106004 RepID=A0A1Y2G636_9BASI|nr:hypothetical protein BCR35DRAFT_323084 [Leucosporidium creatinivorum]